MWKTLTTSKQDKMKNKMKERLLQDNGLRQLDPKKDGGKGNFVSEERLRKVMPDLEKYYEYWIQYPDKFVDLLLPPETHFKLFPAQIVALRANMRYKRVAQSATRGYSKSFIAILTKMLRCIFLPGARDSLVATTMKQAMEIGNAKVQELIGLMPLLNNEIDRRKGSGTSFQKDFINIVFKNGASLNVVGRGEATRGGRRHSMLFEEMKDLEEESTNEVILPLLNISRRTREGLINPNEVHQQQLYVGSAGHRNSFGYDKIMEITIASVLDPENNFSWGGDYRIPMHYGLINREFVEDFKYSNTYSEAAFAREYMSKWTSTVEGSLFSYEKLAALRVLKKPEWKPTEDPEVFYVASVDVARSSARSVVEIFKVRKGDEFFTKNLVNIILMEGRNFLYQATKIKELDMMFNFDWIVVDTNGLGVGLVDFLMTENRHPETEQLFPAFNIRNIKEYPDYSRDQKIGSPNKIWVLKTNQHSAGKIHTNAYNELFSGRVKLLIDEKEAKDRLLTLQKGQKMSFEERIRYMAPFKNTSLLIDETSNLKINQKNVNFKLEMIRTDAEKDTFSALEYGLWTISQVEADFYAKKRRTRIPIKDLFFIS